MSGFPPFCTDEIHTLWSTFATLTPPACRAADGVSRPRPTEVRSAMKHYMWCPATRRRRAPVVCPPSRRPRGGRDCARLPGLLASHVSISAEVCGPALQASPDAWWVVSILGPRRAPAHQPVPDLVEPEPPLFDVLDAWVAAVAPTTGPPVGAGLSGRPVVGPTLPVLEPSGPFGFAVCALSLTGGRTRARTLRDRVGRAPAPAPTTSCYPPRTTPGGDSADRG